MECTPPSLILSYDRTVCTNPYSKKSFAITFDSINERGFILG